MTLAHSIPDIPDLPGSTPGGAPDKAAAAAVATRPILVWDAPVRVFHWLLAACFIGAFVTAESERFRLLHVTLGYTVGGLVVFRLLWGLLGTRYARFSAFVRGPRAVQAYVSSMVDGRAQHHVGHNPAGAWAIVGLLAGAAVVVASGWAVFDDIGGGWLEELHEGASNAMLGLVAVHVLGVIVSSRLHHENLVRSMLTGRKLGRPDEAIRSAWRSVAALMVVVVAGFWSWQFMQAPDPGAMSAQAQATSERHRAADRDDD